MARFSSRFDYRRPLVSLRRPSGEGPALEFRKPGLVSQSELQALELNSKPLQRHE
jgi:hypothetical protein